MNYCRTCLHFTTRSGGCDLVQKCEVDRNPTVGENLESRIAMLKTELARLEASRETMAPLLNMRIRDIRDAMNY